MRLAILFQSMAMYHSQKQSLLLDAADVCPGCSCKAVELVSDDHYHCLKCGACFSL